MAKTASRKTDATGGQPDFEAALNRLEEIVEKLDDGNVPLAQSLALFKEGTALAKRCRDLLSSAELAVKEALRDASESDKPQGAGSEERRRRGGAGDDGDTLDDDDAAEARDDDDADDEEDGA